MPPEMGSSTEVIFDKEETTQGEEVFNRLDDDKKYKREIKWFNVLYITVFHVDALYGLYLVFTSAKLATTLFAVVMFIASAMGVTCGTHRLWSHRAYKANLTLRIILMILNTMAFENTIFDWVRDHRVHHKYVDTNADPHSIKRGFFFAHIGWLFLRKHPDVTRKGKTVDVSDVLQDPVVSFQYRYYRYLMAIFCFGIPSAVPVYFWSETWSNAFHVAGMLRYVYLLHCIWMINSSAHYFGRRPYEKGIEPTENILVAVMTLGEGWHNYHHTFPWDYRASELGVFRFNLSSRFIDFFAKIGWAYDLRTAPLSMVQLRAKRKGDGTYGESVWGWGDKDMKLEDRRECVTLHESGVKQK